VAQLEQPLLIPVSDSRYKLALDYHYSWTDSVTGLRCMLSIPQGFLCDGASVPRCAWTLSGLRPDGLIRAAALVHDFIYRRAGVFAAGDGLSAEVKNVWIPAARTFTRAETDNLFLRIMKEAGMGWCRRTLAYTYVRAVGWIAWRKYEKRLQKDHA